MKKRKRMLFITTTQIYKSELFGIKKKLLAQKNAMENIGLDVDFINIKEPNRIFKNNDLIYSFKNHYLFSLLFYTKLLSKIKRCSYDYVYIRNTFVFDQIGYVRFLKYFKNAHVILEIPTFPYKKEKKTFFQRMVYLNETLFRFKLKEYVDLILYSGNNVDKIWGVKAKSVNHGVNLDKLKKSESIPINNLINLIAVASFSKWHGYERLLQGINIFKQENTSSIKAHLFLVGDREPLFSKFKSYVKENELSDFVTMTGSLQNKELDSIFDKSHIGIASIGMHRIGLSEGSPLKTSEYAARGIPFVVGYKDSNFSNKNYCFTIKGDESPVNISEIIDWYKSIDIDRNDIRNYTLKNFSWETQLKTILKENNQ